MLAGAPCDASRKQSVAGHSDFLGTAAVLQDGEVAEYLGKLERRALEGIEGEQVTDAVGTLKKMEEVLEQMSTQGKAPDRDIVVCMLNNTACCYQKMGSLEKCAAYLEACTIYTVSLKSTSSKLAEVLEAVKRAKQQCLVHVQLCAVLSQLGNHEGALEKAKVAVRLSHFCIDASLQASKLHYSRYQQTVNKSEAVSDALEQTHSIVRRAVSTLKSAQELIRAAAVPHNPEQPARPNFPMKSYADWVYELSISDIMFIEPIAVAEMKAKNSIKAEFSKDVLLDKVANAAVGYFCVSTELQFLRGKQAYNPERDKEAEFFHKKSLQLLEHFFPSECPLLQHISQTYEKRFVSDLQEIPEEGSPANLKGSRPRGSRNHSKTPSQDSAPSGKLPTLRTAKPIPKTPSSIPRKDAIRPKVQRKSSLEVRSKDPEKVKSESNFPAYHGRRKLTSRPSDPTHSFDRERRNKSAEIMHASDSAHLEEYLLGVEVTIPIGLE